MAEVLQLANKVLPLSLAAKIQVRIYIELLTIIDSRNKKNKLVPDVFSLASDYKQGEHRIIGTSALSSIDSFNRNRTRLETVVAAAGNRPR